MIHKIENLTTERNINVTEETRKQLQERLSGVEEFFKAVDEYFKSPAGYKSSYDHRIVDAEGNSWHVLHHKMAVEEITLFRINKGSPEYNGYFPVEPDEYHVFRMHRRPDGGREGVTWLFSNDQKKLRSLNENGWNEGIFHKYELDLPETYFGDMPVRELPEWIGVLKKISTDYKE